MIDATIVRAHQRAGAKGNQIKRWFGLSTRFMPQLMHSISRLYLTPGQKLVTSMEPPTICCQQPQKQWLLTKKRMMQTGGWWTAARSRGRRLWFRRRNAPHTALWRKHLYKARHLVKLLLPNSSSIEQPLGMISGRLTLGAIYLAASVIWLNWWHALTCVQADGQKSNAAVLAEK